MGSIRTKEALELIRKGITIEDQEKIMDLREYILEVEEERLELKRRVQELESQLQTAKDLTFKEPFYYADGDDVPYCAKCWEADRTAVHVVEMAKDIYDCPNCKYRYLPENKDKQRGISSSQLIR